MEFSRQMTLQLFYEKHPASKNADDEVLMSGEKPCVYPVIYVSIDEDLLKRVALKTHYLKVLQKLWKMFFISPLKLFSFSRYFSFCLVFLVI